MKVNIRKVTLNDAQRIMEIYNHYILNTVLTFETEALKEEQVKNGYRNIPVNILGMSLNPI
jgi:L-amino acid N-acyltransferase YncA